MVIIIVAIAACDQMNAEKSAVAWFYAQPEWRKNHDDNIRWMNDIEIYTHTHTVTNKSREMVKKNQPNM